MKSNKKNSVIGITEPTKKSVPADLKSLLRRKIYVYFISFHWTQGKDKGYACYEQPFLERVSNISQLSQAAVMYGKMVTDSEKKRRKDIPVNQFWKKFKINTKPFNVFALNFTFLREQYENVPEVKQGENKNVEIH